MNRSNPTAMIHSFIAILPGGAENAMVSYLFVIGGMTAKRATL